ncbi:MAG: hypothetical protein HFH10_04625 [Dorea sp.]|nr:hypothetical protein [Dorea sp.]
MSVTYYRIKDLNLIGKMQDNIPYIYITEQGWAADTNNILMDRIMGYDETEPKGSPYAIGNSSIMELVEEISEDEAERFIKTNER